VRKKGAGGAGKARARYGGKGQSHGNLLERANTPTQALDQTFAPSPARSLNARRRKLTDMFAAWNVVTHGTNSEFRSCFVLVRVGQRVKVPTYVYKLHTPA
jgi:hypothetical protein